MFRATADLLKIFRVIYNSVTPMASFKLYLDIIPTYKEAFSNKTPLFTKLAYLKSSIFDVNYSADTLYSLTNRL